MPVYALDRDHNHILNFGLKIIQKTSKTKNNDGFRQTGSKGLDGFHLAQDVDQWLAFVSTLMDHTIP